MENNEKWDRARTLMLESLYKPDHQLRSCAFNQECKDDLMIIRDQVIELVQNMSNPHIPPTKIPFGQKNNHVEPTITTPMGEISETLMSGALGDYYNGN
tara:strand:- start:236 stop:532 length:297 start_codon:yes stop_codon:yes gene_type:complete